MNGKYLGYVAGEDPLHGFLSQIMRDRLRVREPQLAFRVFRLSGSNEVYGYEEKFSGAKVICKFYGTRFGTDLDRPRRPVSSRRQFGSAAVRRLRPVKGFTHRQGSAASTGSGCAQTSAAARRRAAMYRKWTERLYLGKGAVNVM